MGFLLNRHLTRYGRWGRYVNAALFGLLVLLTQPALGEGPVRILALGDSLTAGLGLSRPDSFPARLQQALTERGHSVRVINAGLSGDTSAGGLARIDWALSAVAGGGPDMVIVELGANDGLRGLDPEASFNNLDAILEKLKDKGITVLLAGMRAPPNLGREYGRDFNGIYPRLAAKHGVALYPFFLDGVAAVRSLNQDDGIHPNAEGVDIIVNRMRPYIERLLTKK